MIRWYKRWMRTRRALRELNRQFITRSIEIGRPGCDVRETAKKDHFLNKDKKMVVIARQILLVKALGADDAMMVKLQNGGE